MLSSAVNNSLFGVSACHSFGLQLHANDVQALSCDTHQEVLSLVLTAFSRMSRLCRYLKSAALSCTLVQIWPLYNSYTDSIS